MKIKYRILLLCSLILNVLFMIYLTKIHLINREEKPNEIDTLTFSDSVTARYLRLKLVGDTTTNNVQVTFYTYRDTIRSEIKNIPNHDRKTSN